MPEAFPDFDKKPPATPAADSDGTDEAPDPQEHDESAHAEPPSARPPEETGPTPGEGGSTLRYEAPRTAEEKPSPADDAGAGESAPGPGEAGAGRYAPPPTDDPYESPYHAGIDGSGSRPAGGEPAAATGGPEPDEAIGLDGTGMAGLMRRWAVARSADASGRQTVLGLADHVEAVEARLGGVLARPLRDRGMDGLARRVERNPLATIAGAVLAGWIVNRMFD